MNKHRLTLVIAALAGTSMSYAGYVVNSFSAPGWGGSDVSVGVSGYTIEDFEDLTLASGLQVGVVSPNGNYGPSSSLLNTFKPSDDLFGTAFTLGGGGVWDGEHGIINTRTNQTFSYSDSGSWGDLTFYFSSGMSSVGFSVQQMDRDALIMVNGTSIGAVSTLATNFTGGKGRQGYLRVDAVGGDTISSIGLKDPIGGDGYMFDHLAYQSVPEPVSLVALGGGLAILARRRKGA